MDVVQPQSDALADALAERIAERLRVLGEPTRIELLDALRDADATVSSPRITHPRSRSERT